MIVASFYAPRPEHPRWRDYLPSLALLQASCDRLGLRHVVLGDAPVDGFEVFLERDLPRALMPAVLAAQEAGIRCLDDDLLLVGADCVIAREPREPLDGADMAVTLGDFWDCPLNTGAIWVKREARGAAADLWARAAAGMGGEWGDDQLALAMQVSPLPDLRRLPAVENRRGLQVRFLRAEEWNLAPDREDHDCSGAAVLHFRGARKEWSGRWCRRFLGFGA